MITIRNLCKRKGEAAVLNRVDLDVAAGETVAIVGPSGGGKTTFLRCLNGLEPFDDGSIRIAGFDLLPGNRSLSARDAARLRTAVGLVFQELHLFAHLSALENLLLAPRIVRGEATDVAMTRATELLARVGLSGRGPAYPHELSGGQKQRIAIARALAQDPRVLLLDEPTSALDRATTDDVAALITELTRGRVTVVLVTHDLALAARMADRVLHLENGRLA